MRRLHSASAHLVLLSLGFALACIDSAQAQISYTVVNGAYTQNFDSLPSTPTNASLQATVPWTDNASSSATQTSIPGWYLYSATSQAEGGTNGHQRLRNGPGSSGTGSFYSFGVAGTNPVTDRSLGDLTSSTIDTSNIALRLTNNTGSILGSFTLSYTGEQWRDGGAATPLAQSMTFGYAVTAAAPANIGALSVTSVAALNFTSPIFTNTAGGATLDGNASANRTALSTSVGGFVWNPGEDLWLRWTDIDHPGNDHGLSIDDLTFSAGPPVEVNSNQTGPASLGSTWSDGQPAGIGKGYHVINGHVVTLDGPFLGSKLSVENGSVDINSAGSNQFFGAMTIEAGGNLTESVSGDVSVGSDSTSGLKLNRNVGFTLDANSNFRLKASLTGAGNLDFNEATPGSGNNAQVFLDAAGGSTGIIHFNAGKQVNVNESSGITAIEMNSGQSGGNILSLDPKVSVAIASVTYTKPGTLVHAVSATNLTTGIRLQNISKLVANAAVTVDMSQTFSKEERRFLVSAFQGNGNVTVNGTATDPTSPNSGGTSPNFSGITLNEFEVGAQGTDPAANSFEPYSGTITASDYVNVEIRRNLPYAKVVVGQNARLETGAQAIPLPVNAGTSLGEVVVGSGGVFEVGFEQANTNTVANGGNSVEGHHVGHVNLTTFGGRTGNLTLTGGATPSTLRMQINGTDQTTQYDYVKANGNVALAGNLDVLINPNSCTGNDPCGANVNPFWSPTVNDTFDIIQLTAGPVIGDYDGNGSVGNEDYTVFQSTFGSTVPTGTGADGDRDGTIGAGDFVIWRKKFGATATIGSVSGTFDNLNIIDPNGTLASQGLTLQVVYASSTLVQLKAVAAGSGASLTAAIPEPGTITLLGFALPVLLVGRRRKSGVK